MKKYSDIKKKNVHGRGDTYIVSFPDTFESRQQIVTTYVPQDNERFDNIAYKFYNDSSKWYIIAKANKAVTGKLYANRGVQLVIPSL